MSINEVSKIQSSTNYVINNLDKETVEAAEQIVSLFSQSYYNGGSESASSVLDEIDRLEKFISKKETEYKQTYSLLKLTSEELNRVNAELEKTVFDLTRRAEKDEQEQRIFIQRAIDETNELYMNGKIEKEDMSGELAKRVAQYNKIDSSILADSNKLGSVKSKISALTNKISSIIDSANTIEEDSKLAQGTLVLMNNLMSKMTLGTTNSSTSANEKPVYTPTKQALIDELSEGIKGLTADGTYDKNSMDNPQMVKLKEFLGLNGDGQLNEDGVLADSVLNRMKDEGFTEKEALYAINWIFDKCNMKYETGGTWSVPYGHGAEAKEVYSTLLDQTEKLWGSKGEQYTDTTVSATTQTSAPAEETETSSSAVSEVKRTDPIGYSIGDVTYEFIKDRNSDGKFNGKSEFLGAENGIDELKAYDKNNDGLIDNDELNSDENLFVLTTNHKTGHHSFMSMTSGNINSIDLNSLTSKNWTNINDNQVRNIFTINTVTGETVNGYQTEDSDSYINASYNGVEDAEMSVTVDESAITQAKNIFAQITKISDDEYANMTARANSVVKSTQAQVNKTSDKMENNANQASNSLTTVDRPESEEEAEEREAKEAQEEQIEQEEAKAKEEEKKAKEEAEAKAKEEEKKAKEKAEAEAEAEQ